MLSPAGKQFQGEDQRAPLREALRRHGQMQAGQTAGRLYPMACVSPRSRFQAVIRRCARSKTSKLCAVTSVRLVCVRA